MTGTPAFHSAIVRRREPRAPHARGLTRGARAAIDVWIAVVAALYAARGECSVVEGDGWRALFLCRVSSSSSSRGA